MEDVYTCFLEWTNEYSIHILNGFSKNIWTNNITVDGDNDDKITLYFKFERVGYKILFRMHGKTGGKKLDVQETVLDVESGNFRIIRNCKQELFALWTHKLITELSLTKTAIFRANVKTVLDAIATKYQYTITEKKIFSIHFRLSYDFEACSMAMYYNNKREETVFKAEKSFVTFDTATNKVIEDIMHTIETQKKDLTDTLKELVSLFD